MTQSAEAKSKGENSNASNEEFMKEGELAARWGISVKTLQSHRCSGRGIPYRKLGRNVRYALADVHAFEEASVRSSTSDPGKH